jgi:hypothetical protein
MPRDQQRNASRVDVNLLARWEGLLESRAATITNLSVSGCFVLSGGKVQPGELIRLEIYLPDDEPIYLWGEVVDEADEIGFAARFTSTEDEDHARLVRFIQTLNSSQ